MAREPGAFSGRSRTRGNSSAACSKTSLESLKKIKKKRHEACEDNTQKTPFLCPGFCDILTILHVEGVGGQSQRGAAVLALEAAAVEELALGAQPLHHVHALTAEEAHVAAADVGWELLSEGALWGNNRKAVFFFFPLSPSETSGKSHGSAHRC